MINFKAIPFFKILIPYLIGILIYNYTLQDYCPHDIFSVVSIVFIGSYALIKLKKTSSLFYKLTFAFCANLFLLVFAFETCYFFTEKNNNNHYSHFLNGTKQQMIGTVSQAPTPTPKGTKFILQVNVINSFNTWQACAGSILVYLKNTENSEPLFIGDNILLNTKPALTTNAGNPNEFDYKAHLERKNIYHTIFIDTKSIHKINNQFNRFSFLQLGSRIQYWVVNVLRNSHLSDQAFAIASALLVGYDAEIEDSVIESFSHSGTLHILSVSGLHTGVLYGILVFIFSVFDKNNRFNTVRCFSVIACLFLFVLITGISPSVLRASVMLTFILIGKTYFKNGNAYNTLFLSAFTLLVINPYLIFNIGFLLSYAAVFGIMYFYPLLSTLFNIQNAILKWIWNSAAISIAATLFTLPISLYCFHQFPIWFVIANIVIIPISIGILFSSIAVIITYKIVFIKQLIVFLINQATQLMIWLVGFTDNSTFGYIDEIAFNTTDLVFCVISILSFLLLLHFKSYKYMVVFFIIGICWLLINAFNTIKSHSETEFIVFNINKKSVCAVRNDSEICVLQDSALTQNNYQRYIKPYTTAFINYKTKFIDADMIYLHNAIITTSAKSIMLEKNKELFLLVRHNNPIDVSIGFAKKPLVIADCSNSYQFIKELKQQCDNFNVPFYSVKDKGAFKINLIK